MKNYVVSVKTITWTGQSNNQYMQVVLTGKAGKEHKNTVFDPSIQDILTKAKTQNKSLSIMMDKNDKGYWEILEATILDDPPSPANQPSTSPNASHRDSDQMTKDDWDIKDKIKRISIERQTAANIAFATWKLGDEIEPAIVTAQRIAKFLETGS